MITETDSQIIVPNPEYSEGEFRMNAKGEVNIVGKTNFGAGITGTMGLLKGNGKTVPTHFIFSKPKWSSIQASGWVEKYKGDDYTQMIDKENFNDEVWVDAEVTRLNEEFSDGRVIVGIDVPKDKDIIVRDLHSEGFTKTIGITNHEHISFDDNGVMKAKWKVTDSDLKDLIKSSIKPKSLFQYSPELIKPVRYGKNRSGVLDAFVVTENPSWKKSKTTKVHFQALDESSEHFSKKDFFNMEAFDYAKSLISEGKIDDSDWKPTSDLDEKYNIFSDKKETFAFGQNQSVNKQALNLALGYAKSVNNKDYVNKLDELNKLFDMEARKVTGDKEIFDLQLKIKDLEREKESFESEIESKDARIEKFESEKETFESKISDLEAEKADLVEKFDSKVKDYDDLKADHEDLGEKVSKFENAMKQEKVKEVFEAGLVIGRYKKEDSDKVLKELFEISDERLEEKKENFEFTASIIPKKGLPKVPGVSGSESNDKNAFNEAFD